MAELTSGEYYVDARKYTRGADDDDDAFFNTKEEALEWARAMCLHYGYRVWINNIEYTRKGFL